MNCRFRREEKHGNEIPHGTHRRKRRTLKSVWGALAGLSFLLMLGIGGGVEQDSIALSAGFLMMAASMCAAALFAWLAGWME